jgi:pimeloyl-ACP methyl ester carboxylesterase
MAPMTTFVLVHGGGHGGWCYQKVARLLQADGHVVYAPSLSGLGDRAHLLGPHVDLDLQITDVVNLLVYEDLRDVVLVGHSYGGMVITGAADRAADRVGKLVYLDAANPRNGQSLVDVAGPMMEMARSAGAVVDGIELVLLPMAGAAGFYGVTDPTDQVWMEERFTPHPWACFEQKLELRNEEALWAIPQFHLVCSSTVSTRPRSIIDEARAAGRFWEIDTGHDLMITEPRWVADRLLDVAGAPA